jgi:predicted nicotinamide N-methyase
MQPISDRYKTEQLDMRLAGHNLSLVRVTNTDELYAELVAKGESHADVADERIPYWADLWPSAVALAEEVLVHPLITPGTQVLEIGCGLALPGIAAALRGAELTLTDYLAEPLLFAEYNWKLNLKTAPRLALLDWRAPSGFPPADVLLASDVAYEKRSFDHLPAAFKHLLKPGGTILLSEPNRLMARHFIESLPSQGFSVSRKSVPVKLNGRVNEVSVYEIREIK